MLGMQETHVDAYWHFQYHLDTKTLWFSILDSWTIYNSAPDAPGVLKKLIGLV